ncbi:unnamed protein product [Closterium sp. NIES-64]|nr:unnamed protein product [Closterium sp. NIES-64]
MDPSRHPTPHTQSDNTTLNSHPPRSTTTTTPATAAPETQESQILDRTNTPTAPSTTPSVTPSNYWVYQIPSPSASYEADDDYGLGAAFDDNGAPGEVEEEPTAQPTEPSTTTAAASRHSTARNSPRWTAEEECEVLATFIDLDSQIRARTGQQGRSWYPFVQRDILERNPTWRHDQGALKAKFNRLKAEWRRINDRIRRSGEGRVTNLPPWYHLAERLWDTIAPSNGGSPSGATVPSGSTTGISIRGRRITWGARPTSDSGEGSSKNAWWQYPRKQDGDNDGKKKNAAKRGVGRKAVDTKKPSSTTEMIGGLREHFDKRQDAKWEEFKSLIREVFRGYADERRSRRRRSPQSTSSSEDEA